MEQEAAVVAGAVATAVSEVAETPAAKPRGILEMQMFLAGVVKIPLQRFPTLFSAVFLARRIMMAW